RACARPRRHGVRVATGDLARLPVAVSRSVRTHAVESNVVSTNVSATSRQAGERSTTGSAAADDGRQKLVSLLRRPVVAGVVLFALYAGLSLLNDPDAYLGTDTGGKVASLDAMVDNGG